MAIPSTVKATDLLPGNKLFYHDTLVEILREAEPHKDMFGQSQLKYWASTGSKEGYIIFGKTAVIALVYK